ISVVRHEPDFGGGRVGDDDAACAGDDVKERFVGAAIKLERCAGANDKRRGIGEGSWEQAVGAAPTELKCAAANAGAAAPGGARVVDDESSGAPFGESARTGDGAKKRLYPGADVKAAAAGAQDQIAEEGVAAGLRADLAATLELDREDCAAAVGFAAQFSAGRRYLAGGLNDHSVLNAEIG